MGKWFCGWEPGVVLDVGANIEQTVSSLGEAYANTTIFSFEPVP